MVGALFRRWLKKSDAVVPAMGAITESLEARTLMSAAPTPAQQVAQANNSFAFDLLHQVDQANPGNQFISPYSAATALEMALQGAQGVTASEMIQALHLPSSDIAQAGISALYQLFQSAPAGAGYTISTANRLWVDQNLQVLDSFLTDSQNTFGADPQTVDFSDPQAAADTINAWVSDQTHGKITNLISPDALDAYTGLVLTNAIYFQGTWSDPFDLDATSGASFQIASTEASNVQMMHQTSELGYYAVSGSNGFQALDLPYAGSDLDMVILLPTTYDLDSFASTLSADVFAQITSSFATTNVQVSLPQFEMNEGYNLVQPLKNLGIESAFTSSADFSGITPAPLLIKDVVQKSFIRVDETGTEAAAATGVVGRVSAIIVDPFAPVTFNADHPFLFAIRDRATNAMLFLGSMSDPSNGKSDSSTPPTPLTDTFSPSDPVVTPIENSPPASTIAPGVTTSDLSIQGIVDRNVDGTVGILHGVNSHAKLADLSGTIDWGDATSSPAKFVRRGNKTIAVVGTHRYGTVGNYTISIDVTQTPDVNATATEPPVAMPAMAANVSIGLPASRRSLTPGGTTLSATAGQSFTATLATVDLSLTSDQTPTVTLHWADGTHSTGTLTPTPGGFTISGTHLYHTHGHFRVLIDVWEKSQGKRILLARPEATVNVAAASANG